MGRILLTWCKQRSLLCYRQLHHLYDGTRGLYILSCLVFDS